MLEFREKVEKKYSPNMKNQSLGNYLRTQRRRSGLSQRELGLLLGYKDQGQVSRHERSQTLPPLTTTLAYEVIFRVQASALFPGVHEHVTQVIEKNLAEFEANLLRQSGKGRAAKTIAPKLLWLTDRKAL